MSREDEIYPSDPWEQATRVQGVAGSGLHGVNGLGNFHQVTLPGFKSQPHNLLADLDQLTSPWYLGSPVITTSTAQD